MARRIEHRNSIFSLTFPPLCAVHIISEADNVQDYHYCYALECPFIFIAARPSSISPKIF